MIVQAMPKQIDIEVTSRCNLRCVGCPINAQSNGGEDMSFELFTSIVDRVNWPCTLVPWLNGEPLLHPRYAEMIRYITDRGHRAYITTNGHYWNEELFEHITDDTSVYQIIFSLDGLPKPFSKSIERARPGTVRDKVLDTIERFRKLKIRKNAKLDMAVKIVHRGQDYEEVENYIAYWLLQPGIDYVCVGRMLSEQTEQPMRIYPCRYSDDMFMVIRSDGEVVACSYHPVAHNENYFEFGDVRNDTPLLDIYNNSKMTRFRLMQRQGTFQGPCLNCGFAYTGAGFSGYVNFRDQRLNSLVFTETGKQAIHYRRDYYNEFYSLEGSSKPDSFYRYHAEGDVSRLRWDA